MTDKNIEILCDQCVKCGLCLPHCPTYRILQQEADSPRGRIALIEGLQSGALEPTDELLAHLDRCLLCRACESVCPALVEYNLIMDLARERLFNSAKPRHRPPWKVRMLTLSLSASPTFLRLSGLLVRLYQRSGVQWFVRKTRVSVLFGLADYEAILPPRSSSLPRSLSVTHTAQSPPSPVAIFQGCMGAMLDSDTVEAVRRILIALGHDPIIVRTQQCCGALALHQGDAERARQLARNNIRAFAATNTPILFIATGCGTLLKEYAQLFDNSPDSCQAQEFANRCVEVCDFIARDPRIDHLMFAPLVAKVAFHTPCSLRNVLKCEDAVPNLIRRIPGATAIPLPSNHLCCGAAGSYMLTQPEISQTLLGYKLSDLAHIDPDIMVSSNIGCLLHLQSGALRSNQPVTCLHPVALLAAQLITDTALPASV